MTNEKYMDKKITSLRSVRIVGKDYLRCEQLIQSALLAGSYKNILSTEMSGLSTEQDKTKQGIYGKDDFWRNTHTFPKEPILTLSRSKKFFIVIKKIGVRESDSQNTYCETICKMARGQDKTKPMRNEKYMLRLPSARIVGNLASCAGGFLKNWSRQ